MSETNGHGPDLPTLPDRPSPSGSLPAGAGSRPRVPRTQDARVAPRTEDVGTDYPGAFPNSKKVHVEGSRGVRVPMREIHLTGGEPPLRVYDTSGPRGIDVRRGLPPPVSYTHLTLPTNREV